MPHAPSSEETNPTAGDFRFVFHSPTQIRRNLHRSERSLRLLARPPVSSRFSNVTYTPFRIGPNGGFEGALYDASGQRIELARVRRGLRDEPAWNSPERLDIAVRQEQTRPGVLLYLGPIMPHYGHFLLETLSLWWPLLEAYPDVDGYLIHLTDPAVLEWDYVRSCLEALDIDRAKLIFSAEPMRIGEVIVPEPTFQLESHVNTRYRDTCRTIAHGMGAKGSGTTDQPLFVSRTGLKKGIYKYEGEEAIEAFMAQGGARIIHPESMPLREQIQAFQDHRNIIGIIGSGMHTVMFADEPKRMVYLTPEWINPSCFLIDMCVGNESTYVQAVDSASVLSSLVERIAKHVPLLKLKRTGRFWKHREIDSHKVLAWLAGPDGYIRQKNLRR